MCDRPSQVVVLVAVVNDSISVLPCRVGEFFFCGFVVSHYTNVFVLAQRFYVALNWEAKHDHFELNLKYFAW